MTIEHARKNISTPDPVIVVGGGLAGLTATAELARAGRPVTLFESASRLGGRAVTREVDGFRFHLGPRALYVGGAARQALDRLGVAYVGHRPPLAGASAWVRGRREDLPMGLWSLLTCPWLSLAERFEVAAFLARFPKLDPASLRGESAGQWLERELPRTMSRGLIEALLRLTTYSAEPEHMDAEAAARQLQSGLGESVLYLDHGWQTLVDGLRARAVEAGARVETGAKVRRIETSSSGVECELAHGERVSASAAVLAVGPQTTDRLLGSAFPEVTRYARESRPVHAACLDVGLRHLPRPDRLFLQGIDRPIYLSVHSATARLAPEGGALVHVLRYLRAGETPSREEVRRELEEGLDLMQPGWREHVTEQQLLPRMLVAHDMPSADRERPSGRVSARVHVAGDWVGEPLLADASVDSGSRAARAILETRSLKREERRVA